MGWGVGVLCVCVCVGGGGGVAPNVHRGGHMDILPLHFGAVHKINDVMREGGGGGGG